MSVSVGFATSGCGLVVNVIHALNRDPWAAAGQHFDRSNDMNDGGGSVRSDPTRASAASSSRDASGSALTTPDWRAAVALRWQALGLEVLGIGSGPRRKLSEIGNECQALAIVTALFECGGNLSHTAARLGISPRRCRERLAVWVSRNPSFEPPLPERPSRGQNDPSARARGERP